MREDTGEELLIHQGRADKKTKQSQSQSQS